MATYGTGFKHCSVVSPKTPQPRPPPPQQLAVNHHKNRGMSSVSTFKIAHKVNNVFTSLFFKGSITLNKNYLDSPSKEIAYTIKAKTGGKVTTLLQKIKCKLQLQVFSTHGWSTLDRVF